MTCHAKYFAGLIVYISEKLDHLSVVAPAGARVGWRREYRLCLDSGCANC